MLQIYNNNTEIKSNTANDKTNSDAKKPVQNMKDKEAKENLTKNEGSQEMPDIGRGLEQCAPKEPNFAPNNISHLDANTDAVIIIKSKQKWDFESSVNDLGG